MSQQKQKQNRFLLPGSSSSSAAAAAAAAASGSQTAAGRQQQDQTKEDQENQLSVDTDFDSYWEEEARNPHRNRIRIGRQYQATVPGLLKPGERDKRKLEDLETLSFCPKKSAKVSDSELKHYFTVAKSLNLFASLVETRSLLGRDVTIADLNHIRRKEGLSLASVIQPPPRQAAAAAAAAAIPSPPSSQSQQQQQQQSPQKSPSSDGQSSSSSAAAAIASPTRETAPLVNQPLMKAFSHFISLHHPCHHDDFCKKLQKDIPFEDDTRPAVSITAGNLRQGSSSSASGRSRSSLKQKQQQQQSVKQEQEQQEQPDQAAEHQQQSGDNSAQSSTGGTGGIEDWTREEVELFSKAIEVCGKNFSSIKKEFLPSKSVKSIVEYYYIGSRDLSDNKKKPNQATLEAGGDTCSSPEKSSLANNNGGQGGGSSSGQGTGKTSGASGSTGGNPEQAATTSSSSSSSSSNTPSSRNSANTDTSKNPADTSQVETNQASMQHHIKTEPHTAAAAANQGHAGKSIGINGLGISPSMGGPTKNIDARMSVYNFDDEFKDDNPVQLECPKPGAEVRPLKAKPIIPNATSESDNNNSNVGSLKFFMDGQLVLKLNACQDQQGEGAGEKCHWVQSGEKNVSNAARQKRYSKRSSGEKQQNSSAAADANQNGSQSNSVVSSYQDDDSTKNDDLSNDDDSKESMNSFTNFSSLSAQAQRAHTNNNNHTTINIHNQQQLGSPNSKRFKVTAGSGDLNLAHTPSPSPNQLQHQQLPSPVDYNRLALNNRIKERNDSITRSTAAAEAAAAAAAANSAALSQAMQPWLQANSLAMAALLGGLPFPVQANMLQEAQQQQQPSFNNNSSNINNNSLGIPLNSKPMDLSVEHHHQVGPPPKALQSTASSKSASRSRSRSAAAKNNANNT